MVKAQIIPRLDNIREVSPVQLEAFRGNGHVLAHQLLSREEIAFFRPLVGELMRRFRWDRRRPAGRELYGKSIGQVMNAWRLDEGVKQLILSRRLAKMAADLLGVPNVRIYHDRVLFKEPGGGMLPWHQDQYAWPLDTTEMITLYMPLVDIQVDMGMLSFASGSHKLGPVPGARAWDQSDSGVRKYIKEHHFPINRPAGMMAGDATWYYGNTVYHSEVNEADRVQEVITIIYMADGARVKEPENKAQVSDWKAWLTGLAPGRLAVSELNPLLL